MFLEICNAEVIFSLNELRDFSLFYKMFSSYFFLTNFCVVCVCIVLKFSQCDEAIDGSEDARNNSREQVQPTPLILHLNETAANELMEEANRKFVSNTSFDDIINDNNTHQMLLRYRERYFSYIYLFIFFIKISANILKV